MTPRIRSIVLRNPEVDPTHPAVRAFAHAHGWARICHAAYRFEGVEYLVLWDLRAGPPSNIHDAAREWIADVAMSAAIGERLTATIN